ALKVEIAQRRQTEQELSRALAEVASLQRKLELENRYLSSEVRRQLGDDEIIEQSDAMKAVLAQAAQVASTRSSVLVLGETGVGKEVLARWIHDHSPRRDHPMVKVNCAALPSSLIEAELFGREKGAYTGAMTRQTGRFEIADGSTIFLDEIGDLAPEVQTKLLTVLQDGELQRLGSAKTISVDVRIIAATNRDLAEALEAGKFRSDLYYRLNVFPIVVPPLRERVDDIPALVWTFVKELRETMGKPIEHIAPESMIALQQYAWPGNVRELRNVVERAMIVADGPMMHIPVPVQASDAPLKGTSLQVVERDHIVQTLIRTSWRVRGEQGAAKLLGLKPTTLEARMKKLGIQRPQKTQSDRRTSNIS
ncbi:MAG: sigma 54-interacting transcriptional regulator, partial [Gammaproteobacteria bacterium]